MLPLCDHNVTTKCYHYVCYHHVSTMLPSFPPCYHYVTTILQQCYHYVTALLLPGFHHFTTILLYQHIFPTFLPCYPLIFQCFHHSITLTACFSLCYLYVPSLSYPGYQQSLSIFFPDCLQAYSSFSHISLQVLSR